MSFIIILSMSFAYAKKEKPQPKPRVFLDVVYKIKKEGEKSSVTFHRAAAVYNVTDKKLLTQLQESRKSQKPVQISAERNDNSIREVKGP